MELIHEDLVWAVRRLPKKLFAVTEKADYPIFVGGGYLRSIVAHEELSDVDVFVASKEDADRLKADLVTGESNRISVHKTANALTIRGLGLPVQIITRWLFKKMADISNSFDFTVCCACFTFKKGALGGEPGKWLSYCDDRFYADVAAKRLVYRSPIRNEDAGGSMLRVLKYYQRGYRIPLESLAAVISRLVMGVKPKDNGDPLSDRDEEGTKIIISSLLREVDPLVDPTHSAHL